MADHIEMARLRASECVNALRASCVEQCGNDDDTDDDEVGFTPLDEKDINEPNFAARDKFEKVVDSEVARHPKSSWPLYLTAFFASPHAKTKLLARYGLIVVLAMSFTGTAFSALMIQARAEWTDAIAASLSAREAGGEELAAAFSRAWKALAVMVVMGIIMSGLVQPLMILFFKHYTLSWRLAVTVAYIKAWEQRLDSMPVPEGASQRIHEDVEQMSNSFMRFGSSLLRSIFSLMIFVPKLWYAGDVFPVPWLPQGYLLIMGVFSSGIGLAGAALISRALVGLFVAVQQSEGALRKRLAVMEDLTPLETGTLIGSSLQRIGSLCECDGPSSTRAFELMCPGPAANLAAAAAAAADLAAAAADSIVTDASRSPRGPVVEIRPRSEALRHHRGRHTAPILRQAERRDERAAPLR